MPETNSAPPPDRQRERIGARKTLGYLLSFLFLAVYIVVVATIAPWILPPDALWQLLFYATAGLVWIYPVIKILTWSQKSGG